MAPPALAPTARLALLLAAVTLATSRAGLVLHELGGHGGAAIACGGHVTAIRLFWFAGGWIRYDVPGITSASQLAISLAGIGAELLVGAALWLAFRGSTLGPRLARTVGAALLVHALTYFATGTWHGFGDGHAVHAALGAARYPVAVIAGALACGAAWWGARYLFATLAAAVPERRLAGVLTAITLAAVANGALVVADLRLHRDATYAEIMQPERDRIVARELAAWAAAHPDSAPTARAAQARTLAAAHDELPFRAILAIALLVAVLLGAARSPRIEPTLVGSRLLVLACAIAVIALATVIALGSRTFA